MCLGGMWPWWSPLEEGVVPCIATHGAHSCERYFSLRCEEGEGDCPKPVSVVLAAFSLEVGCVVFVLSAYGVQVVEEDRAGRNEKGFFLQATLEPCCKIELSCGGKVDGDRFALSVALRGVFDGFLSDSRRVHGDALRSVALHHAVEAEVLLFEGDGFVRLDFAQPVFSVVFFDCNGDPVVVSSGDVVSQEGRTSLEEVGSSRLVVLRACDEVARQPSCASVLPVEFEFLLPQAFV